MLKPGTYCVAVSGGIDSVVLLDMLSKMLDAKNQTFVVAHFDHGVRNDSASDAQFVRELAKTYGYSFETKREELGAAVSEERARQRRYDFLRGVAKKYQAKIVTAHHADDVIETIAINLKRGTGWRGLAVMDSLDIVRPLLHMRKAELVEYANAHQLEWREDSTNASDVYLRNRLRRKFATLDSDTHRQLLALRDHQVHTKHLIDQQTIQVAGQSPYSRYLFIMMPEQTALEVLRYICLQQTGNRIQRPQLIRALLKIKTAAAGTRHDVGDGVIIEFSRTEFIVKTPGR